MVKRESDDADRSSSSKKLHSEFAAVNDADYQTPKGRRGIRSRYLAVTNMINDERDEIARPDTDKFDFIFNEVESLHQLVTKPREQVADAKALLDITKSLVMFVKSNATGGLTPSGFVTHILEKFGGQGGPSNSAEDCSRNSIAWNDIGVAVSHVFRGASGCSTMIGPTDAKIKERKVVNRRNRERTTELTRPEVLGEDSREDSTGTDKNMLTMFNILRINKIVKLENLVLNRNSFAQTVENLFALSFLVKDGRAEIKVNEAGWQLVSPRNAPAANAVHSKDVVFSHFVFRCDFNDWKLMLRSVGDGEELMPDRNCQ
ncbi:non-structural maintenance of chromosomes element 4 homolog A-like [Abrus precatorius]|uniref:Non-structural maintenance of chromosomes element 4 n=1 Tax=Abrus precatorius TaxID=3816 RepID=A0A8B8L8L1_ABRPR|nr:non-structural maintenance of chromosomes element 4 homolog A-like [Abrus precatorius]